MRKNKIKEHWNPIHICTSIVFAFVLMSLVHVVSRGSQEIIQELFEETIEKHIVNYYSGSYTHNGQVLIEPMICTGC